MTDGVIALVGNPNSGKTTLFNSLTGLAAKTANYPGVTVEHREASLVIEGRELSLIDLPGTYSLRPQGDDERVAVEALEGKLGQRPDLVLAVLDAAHLERHSYLALQLHEAGLPVVAALTMTDELDASGVRLDEDRLAATLGVKVVRASGRRPEEVAALRASLPALVDAARSEAKRADAPDEREDSASWRDRFSSTSDDIGARFGRASEVSKALSGREARAPHDQRTDRIDKVALHPVFGPLLLLSVFAVMFQALFTWSEPFMGLVETTIGIVGDVVGGLVPDTLPLFRSLLLDGVVSGVGNVLVFIPQIFALFFFLAALDASGYLARAAFLLDRAMSSVGLHGRAFVPLLSGFACAVPALMATRTIERRADRLVTIMVTPLVSCSARLPVYVLIIGTVFATTPPLFGVIHVGALLFFSMYALSVIAAIAVAFILKRTLLKSPTPPLVLELPPYRAPRLLDVLRQASNRAWVFVKDAGTVILACTIVLWALFTFPRSDALEAEHQQKLAALQTDAAGELSDAHAEQVAALEADLAQRRLAHSLGGRLGRAVEPVFAPLGFDWKINVGVLASFAAREVLVSTLGLVYGLGDGADEGSVQLREAMRSDARDDGTPVYTPLTGLSLMVFFVLAMQCMSTLATTRRETRSYRWPAFQFAYMTVLAWVAAFVVFQGGRLLGFT